MVLERKYISEIRIKKELPQDSYFSAIPAIQHIQNNGSFKLSNNITFFVGENGSGKSTLIEAIATASKFNPEGGSLNYSFSTYDTHSDLKDHLTIVRENHPKKGYFLRAETFYNAATYHFEIFEDLIEQGEMPDYHKMSHGELFLERMSRLYGNGLYIFDEPEAALSPSRQLTMMCHINRLLNSNSQFIIATHSPILMAYPGADIFEFNSKGIRKIEYTETEHYQITKSFLDCPERMLRYMLGNE